MKFFCTGWALAFGIGLTATALAKPYNAGSPFQVSGTVQNGNPILNHGLLGHYSSDPSVIEVPDTSGNRVLVMVSSSDLENRTDAGNWPMSQTYLYAVNNSMAGDPILGTWYDHGPVVSEANISWSKHANQLWAPDIQYYSLTNDIWLYVPDRDSSGVFRVGMAHASVSNGLYADAGFSLEPRPMSIPGSPGNGTAFDPGVYSDEVAPFNRRTLMVYADQEYNNNAGNNLSMAELGADHKTATYLGKIKFTGPLAAYNGLTKYMEGPDIFVMQMPGRGGRLFYYMVFSTNVENADGNDTGYVGYAMCSDQEFHASTMAPATCWKFKGWIFRNMRSGRSNHASLIDYGGTHYVFYHTAPSTCCSSPGSRSRQVAVKEIQLRDHQGFDDDGEIVDVTHPGTGQNINDPTLYGSLDGLSTTVQPPFISVRDEDASANSETLDFTRLVNTSTSTTLHSRQAQLYYHFDADPGLNVQVTQPTNVTQSGLALASPPIKHVEGKTWAIMLNYTGGDVAPGATANVSAQIRVTGNTKSNDFSRALGNYVTPTTRLLMFDTVNGFVAGEAPNSSGDNFRVLRTEHKDAQGQFTYLTTSFSDPNVGINNQYVMTGSQSQDWYFEGVTDFSNIQGLGPLSAADKRNAVRLRCKWTGFYMTANDQNHGTAAQPSFYVLSQALHTSPQLWATQIWIKEDVGNGSTRLRSAWLPDVARDTNQLPIYLTLQTATGSGKQDVFVQLLNTSLDTQKWIGE